MAPFHVPLSGIAVHVFTPQGLALAERLLHAGEAALHAAASLQQSGTQGDIAFFSSLADHMREHFHRYRAHVFIGAAGIAVRAIAPHIRSKATDPAVLVVDQKGRHVISLLSGHQGKGNALARRLAERIGAEPVITTATDAEGLPAVDEIATDCGLRIVNAGAVKGVSGALLRGERPLLADPLQHLRLSDSDRTRYFTPAVPEQLADAPDAPAVLVSSLPAHEAAFAASSTCLLLQPPVYAGIGCKRGTPAGAIQEAIACALRQADTAPGCLVALASIEAKRDEQGLQEAAADLSIPLLLFTPQVLRAFPVTAPSPKALATFQVAGVCEPAALAAAGQHGPAARLVLPKTVHLSVTVALARPSFF